MVQYNLKGQCNELSVASDSFYEEFIEYYDGNNKMTYEFLPQIGIFNGGADMMS